MIARAARFAVTASVAVTGVCTVAIVGSGALTGGVQSLAVPVAQTPLQIAPQAEAPAGEKAKASSSRTDPGWIGTTASRSNIEPRGLQAYADATLTLKEEQPTCRLGWTTLAAIAEIESGHGSHGGSALAADGRTEQPIIGPALNGKGGYAAIRPDAAAIARHGDSQWDRAVGPFQFIGSTWAKWQADGDADGVADPHDIDDAALAAGRYLCAAGTDLSTAQGWRDAVFSYNHSDEYVDNVRSVAHRYLN